MTSTLRSPSTHDDSDASAVAERRRPRRPRLPDLPDRLPERLAVAIPGVAVLVAAVIIGGALFALVAGIIAVLALYELYSLTAAMRPLRWAGFLGALVTIGLAWFDGRHLVGLLEGFAVGLALIAIAGMILPRRDDVTNRMATTLMGLAYIGLPMGVLVLARELPHGGGVVAVILVGTWAFDTAAYLGGYFWGTTPIAPRISPKKTVEGTAIGAVVGVLAVWVAGLYQDWIAGWESLVLGVAICAGAYVGDLFESMLKRDAGAKDSGRLLLAHGGVLDRFDALLFSAVAGYLMTIALVL